MDKSPSSKQYSQGVDALGAYFGDINGYRLLTVKEEFELGHRIQTGKIKHDLQTLKELDGNLMGKSDVRKSATEILTLHNLRLVVDVAKSFADRGINIEDLVQEGYFGLRKAVEGYDPNRGNKFSTYAVWWIRQVMGRATNNEICPGGRFPAYVHELAASYKAAMGRLQSAGNYLPTDAEIGKEMGISKPAHVKKALEKVWAYQAARQDTLSLSDSGLGSALSYKEQDSGQMTAYWELIEKIKAELDGNAPNILSPREKEILRRRFGVECKEATLKEVGKYFKIGGERARQIEKTALEKLYGAFSVAGVSLEDIF